MFPVKAFERIRKGKEDDSQRVKESNTDANRRSDFPIGPDQTAYRHGPIGKSDLQQTDVDLFIRSQNFHFGTISLVCGLEGSLTFSGTLGNALLFSLR